MALGGKRRKSVTSPSEPEFEVKAYNPQTNLEGVVENQPVVTQVAERKSIVDTEYMPVSHLVIHTEGDGWIINYYRQLVGLDDPLRMLEHGALAVHQQYEKIKRYEIKVDSPLDQTQDNTTKEFTVTGSAGVTYGLIPNKGDMFVADIGNGKAGLFVITNSTRKAYTKQATYQIEYLLVAEYDEYWETELEGKVVKTVVFEKGMIELYDTPFMTEKAHTTYLKLNEHDRRLRDFFMQSFWSTNVHSIKMPGQLTDIYDGFHADFCKFIGLGDIRKPIDLYRYGYTDLEDVYSLWELFKEMSLYQMPLIHRDFGNAPVKAFSGVHVQRGIAWSAYDYAVFPDGEFYDIDGRERIETSTVDLRNAVNDKEVLALPEALQLEMGCGPRPMFPRVTFKPYVLSTAFYDGKREDMSVLELELHRALSGEATNAKAVSAMCNEIYTEARMSQYYFIPLLLVLIHFSRRGGE